MMNIDQLCDRIVAWVRNAPSDYECKIGDPASDEDLARLAKLLPTGAVPRPLETLLKHFNGLTVYYQGEDEKYDFWFEFIPIEEMIGSTEVFRQINLKNLQLDEPYKYQQVSGPV